MPARLLVLVMVLWSVPVGRAHADSNWSQLKANAEATKKAAAQEGWQGSISLGYLATTGNTDTSSLNGKALFGYKSGNWQDALLFQAISTSLNGATTAESYEANAQSNYSLTEKNYAFGAADYLTDRFSGYRRRLTEAFGYGRRVLDSDTQQLDLELGGGARQTRYTDGSSDNVPIERLAGSYGWKFSANSNFLQTLSVEHGTDNTFTQSITALTANLSGNFALSVSYTIKRNSTVLPGFRHTDTATAISLVYTFAAGNAGVK